MATDDCHARLRKERKAWGVCTVCGKPLHGEKTFACKKCNQRQAEYREENRQHIRETTKERMDRYRAAGLCIYCGKPAVEGKKLCQYHRNYYARPIQVSNGDKIMKNKPKSLFTRRLIEARRAKGLSQMDFALELDVSVSTVSFWETDQRQPKLDKLPGIAETLEVSLDWLLGVSG